MNEQRDNVGNLINRSFNEEGWMLAEVRNGRRTAFEYDKSGVW